MLSGERIKLEKISLPIDNNKNPDWEEIETIGKKFYNKKIKSISKEPLNKDKIKLDTQNWKSFKIWELF